MVKLRDLEICYERPSVYAGGQLSGTLTFRLREPTKLKELAVLVEGQSRVTLPGETTEERWLLKKELRLEPYLAQHNGRLPAGLHQVPFVFCPQPFLPSSFGDKHGYVYYCCRALVNGVIKTHKPFTLIGIEDLNWHPYAAMPVNFTEFGCKSFWSFGRPGAVQVVLKLDRSGFVPGDTISVSAEIVNQSRKKLRSSTVQLRQGVLYRTPSGRSKETLVGVAELRHGCIPPNCVEQWEQEPLPVPPLPPSFLRGADGISLKYELTFSVPDADVQIVVPVIIGTVPFRQECFRQALRALPWKPADATATAIGAADANANADADLYAKTRCDPAAKHRQRASQQQQQLYDDQSIDDENNNRSSNGFYHQRQFDENNRNGHHQAVQQQQQQQNHYQSRTNAKVLEQPSVNGRQCYYYSDNNRFLRIEEID